MRTPSVNEIKTGHDRTHPIPAEGTALRALYDVLKANRGNPVQILKRPGDTRPHSYLATALSQLENFYGCDIKKVAPRKYMLVGEWFGSYYADYMSEVAKEREYEQGS
jgi:hypothetical protein